MMDRNSCAALCKKRRHDNEIINSRNGLWSLYGSRLDAVHPDGAPVIGPAGGTAHDCSSARRIAKNATRPYDSLAHRAET
jgi:hypothetical protein